ncbi:MAG: hypothetical protein M3N21_01685 [Actinomycetota bacterium]|nr:hypothetical protein [Actinomycetota bacterium]
MTPTASHVDALVVNYGTGDLVRKGCACVSGPGVHLWVWDNSGELLADPPPDLAALCGDGTNQYFARPNNELFAQCDGDYVLLLNPDVELEYATLQRLVQDLVERPAAWGAAPRLLNPDGSDQDYLQRLPDLAGLLADRLPPARLFLGRAYRRYMAHDVDLAMSHVAVQPPAACLLLRRSALGGALFDESYRLFCNDTDLARRLNADGHCWYDADATAVHLRGESFTRERRRSGFRIAREYDRTVLRYARRNIRGWWVLIPVVALRIAVTSLVDGARSVRRGRR